MHTADTVEAVKAPAIQVVEEQKPDPDRAILESLHHTVYACSSVQRIHGGFLNATYRGSLIKPQQNGMRTVIIKHSEEKDSKAPQLTLSLTRCVRSIHRFYYPNSTAELQLMWLSFLAYGTGHSQRTREYPISTSAA